MTAAAFWLIILGICIMKLVPFAPASQRGLQNVRFEYSLAWPSLFLLWLSNAPAQSPGFSLYRMARRAVPEAMALSH